MRPKGDLAPLEWTARKGRVHSKRSQEQWPRNERITGPLALELVKTSHKSINEIERDLGITPGLVHKWKARMKVDGEQAFPGKGRLKEDEELIRRLKRENEVLRQEREVLKKAIAIFSERAEKSTSS